MKRKSLHYYQHDEAQVAALLPARLRRCCLLTVDEEKREEIMAKQRKRVMGEKGTMIKIESQITNEIGFGF
ncbi:hypothetical protein U1Q18_013755 [Sarracenia purpurea var. burkii]